ncbi:MAG: LD-carboxypeptidase, partial [Lachnospiraceae bacterium]|nr:LD-carboxypeptidase [Lachnospiraceae bacterium]
TAVIKANPKWMVGFSDITALHAMMTKLGIASVHGPMSSHLTKKEPSDTSLVCTFHILEDSLPITYFLPPNEHDIHGHAEGRLVGGNLMVANGLAQTEYDILNPSGEEGFIIFIEDVGEKIYAIERVMTRLHQSGALKKAKGLIVGEFTNYKPSDDFDSMEDMISYWLRKWGYAHLPVLFGMPSGHGDVNYPLVLGAKASLTVAPEGSTLTMALQ